MKKYTEERPWGIFEQFTKNQPSTVKIITVRSGESLSLQYHQKRSEFWRVINGSGIFEIEGVKKEGKIGDEFFVNVGEKHRIFASPTEDLQVLEIATGDFDENDIVRVEDRYGRN